LEVLNRGAGEESRSVGLFVGKKIEQHPADNKMK
jgi:hypothetical protein